MDLLACEESKQRHQDMAGFNSDLREVGWAADWTGNLKLGGMKRNAKDIQRSFFAGKPCA